MLRGVQRGNTERIVQVATDLFSEKGFPNVSVREICGAAGVSVPTIYYYFGSKKGLFEAVAKKAITLKDFISLLGERLKRTDDVFGKICVFVSTYITSFPRGIVNLGLYVRDSTDMDQMSMRRLSGYLDKIHALLEGIIVEGIRRGRLRKTDPSKAADCLLGMMNRYVFQLAHFKRDYDSKAVGEYITDFFVRAMKA